MSAARFTAGQRVTVSGSPGTVEFADEHGANVIEDDGDVAYFFSEDIVAASGPCPRCGGGIPNNATPGKYVGALSRVDNKTEICSSCGTNEAMFGFSNPGKELPPVNQEVWA